MAWSGRGFGAGECDLWDLKAWFVVGDGRGEVGGDGVAGRKCFKLLFIKLGLGGRYNGGLCYARLCVFGCHRLNVLFRKSTGSCA